MLGHLFFFLVFLQVLLPDMGIYVYVMVGPLASGGK